MASLDSPSEPTASAVADSATDLPKYPCPRVFDALRYFDGALEGREFLAGEAYSVADILLLCTADFAGFVGMAVPADLTHLQAWHARVSARPSAAA